VAPDSQVIAPRTSEALLAKLNEPRVAEALYDLLDHLDLLAVLVEGLDALARRGDTIAGNLTKAVGELRLAVSTTPEALKPIDLPKLASSLRILFAAISDATPGLEALFRSDLTDPRVVEVVSMASRALRKGAEQDKREPVTSWTVFSLLRVLKDEDVARGLGFLIQVAKALGHELNHG